MDFRKFVLRPDGAKVIGMTGRAGEPLIASMGSLFPICALGLGACVLSLSCAFAQEKDSPKPAISPSLVQASEPMRFQWIKEGPREACRDRCREWIAAGGTITEQTPKEFAAFAQGRDVRGATVLLESTGGVVSAGLALGREFRRLGVTTSVGRTGRLPPAADGEQRATLSPRAVCNSMCVFLLIGGARRNVPDEARILVHQIWPSSLREDAAAATYSAGHMVATQRMLGQIARYVIDMGADIELFEIATRIPPWESLRPLTRDDLRRMRVHTVDDPFNQAPLSATAPAAHTGAAPPAASPFGQSWSLVGTGEERALARRHPLTIEGQEIGSFEIMFSCADRYEYRVIYRDTRKADLAGKTGRVASVELYAGRARVPLNIDPAGADDARSEAKSTARGSVPKAFLELLTGPSPSPLIIRTVTTNKLGTTIRVGSAGLQENYRSMAAGCS
jgi:hypothetical protein